MTTRVCFRHTLNTTLYIGLCLPSSPNLDTWSIQLATQTLSVFLIVLGTIQDAIYTMLIEPISSWTNVGTLETPRLFKRPEIAGKGTTQKP
jgi:hypothetical protein